MIHSVLCPIWPLEPFSDDWHHLKRGEWGERAVARRLWFEGYRLLAHRWVGEDRKEIDLVAANDELILFCEVKVRTSLGDAAWLEIIDDKRLDNLRTVAGEYLRRHRQTRVAIQFNAYLVKPSLENRRTPVIETSTGYLNPATVPGWKGIRSRM